MSLDFSGWIYLIVKHICQVKVLQYKLTLFKNLDGLLTPHLLSQVPNTRYNSHFSLWFGQAYFFLATHGPEYEMLGLWDCYLVFNINFSYILCLDKGGGHFFTTNYESLILLLVNNFFAHSFIQLHWNTTNVT